MSRSVGWSFALSTLFVLAAACGERPAGESPHATGHLFSEESSGIAIDLPAVWAGRYRVSDTVTAVTPGLLREFTLRFVRADSSVTPQPLAVVRLFETARWEAFAPDSASVRWGTRIGGDAAHTLAIAPARENPLPPGSADALGFDTLMIALNQRPLRARLRADAR